MAVRRAERDFVRALPLFRELSEVRFDELTARAVPEDLPQHATLLTEGTLPDFLYVVVDGTIGMFSTHDRHETTIDIVRPGTAFVVAAVIRDAVYLSSARTLTPARVVRLPAETVRRVFERDPVFARAVANDLAERSRCLVRSLKNEKLRTGAERLANWILRANALQGAQRIIELGVEKRTLASRLGMTPESLSRNLARLSRFGVRICGRDIVIEDSRALERFAKPNTLIDG
jgi:CRP/FNR family transcriptional activator FtrB